jgi:hypothetical protein
MPEGWLFPPSDSSPAHRGGVVKSFVPSYLAAAAAAGFIRASETRKG